LCATFASSKNNQEMDLNQSKCWKNAEAGLNGNLSIYKKKRLIIFNCINAFGFLLGICWFAQNIFLNKINISVVNILLAAAPIVITFFSFLLIFAQKHKVAIYLHTMLIPVAVFVGNMFFKEGSALLYILIYSIFPFFFHTKFYKITLHYILVIALYLITFQQMALHQVGSNGILFSYWFQIAAFVFFYAVLFLVKVQVLAYERILKNNKAVLNNKNNELIKLLGLKDQIFTVIAHDIIVPLNSMQMIATQIIDEGYDKELLEEVFPVMNDEIIKTKNLFTNLLDWSKAQLEGKGKETSDVQVYEVADIVLQQISQQAKLKNIKITNNIDKQIIANVNYNNLMVAMRNLLVNAIKFTPEKGSIKLGTKVNEDSVQLNITDSGDGITSEVIKRIFGEDIYTSVGTNQETGNGFGLKISRELIKQNGGSVFCESTKVGEGSTFAIKMKIGKPYSDLELVA
jgi:two-component system, sensor histidine kinase and response regulator